MNRVFLVALLLIQSACSTPSSTERPIVTQWNIEPSIGLDALLLIGAASGDIMQAEIYADEIAELRAQMSPEGLAAMDEIDGALRRRLGRLTGPTLALTFSAGPVATLEDVIASAADPVGRLKPGLQQAPHWNEREFEAATRLMPTIHTALTALRDTGFVEQYNEETLPTITAAIESDFSSLLNYDVIPEQARLLGRTLDSEINVYIVRYAQPYGIRIVGQSFISYYDWDAETQLQIAAHEIFHPPFDRQDPELLELLSDLRADAWFQSIVQDHDPRFGYNSFMGVVDEGSTKALDQIVSERLGFAQDLGERLRQSDGGMHMLTAALYHAMIETGFADAGGTYEEWFKAGLRSGLLSPAEIRRRAALVVGQEAVDAWGPHRSRDTTEQPAH